MSIYSEQFRENDDNRMTAVVASAREVAVPDATPQLVFLDFDGAETFYRNEALDISIKDVSVSSSGFDDVSISLIVSDLNGMFGDDIVFTASMPATGAFSTIYVGVTSAFDGYGRFLGLAETIDSGNQIHDDNAFVLLDSTASADFVTSVIAHETEHIVHGMAHSGEGLNRYATDYVVTDGEVIDSIEISFGDILRVESDGLVVSAAVNDGAMIVSDCGVAGITPDGDAGSVFIANGGILSVESGGEAHNVTNDGGHMDVVGTVIRTSLCAGSMTVSGGTANSTTMQAGLLEVYNGGLASSLVVSSQGTVNVSNGGKASGVTLRGNMTVSSGGFAETVSVYAGGEFTVDGGSAQNVNAYYDNGTMTVINNGRAENMILHSGGTMDISDSGVIYNTELKGGCTMVVHDGGSASAVSVSGVMNVFDDGVASGNTIEYGTINLSNGGVASDTTMNGGVMNVYSGGSASDIDAMGGTLNVAATAELYGADIGGATVNVASGVVARNLEVNAGTLNVEAGADVDGVTYNGGTFIISGGVTIKNLYKIAGGTINMYGDAVIDGGVLEGGGYLQAFAQNGASGAVIRNYELRGGAADAVIVRGGGNLAEKIAVYGGVLHIQSGASASNVDVYEDGTIATPDAGRGGATMENIRIHAGGQGIFAANAARAMTIDGLTMDAYTTATFSSANIAHFNATGGELTLIGLKNYVSGSGTLNDLTVLGNGQLWINDPYDAEHGGAAYAQMVNSNMTVEAGATVLLLGTNVHGSDAQVWGNYYVQNGATLSGGTIHAGGYLYMGQRSNYNDNGARAKAVGVSINSSGTVSVADGDFINMAMESGAIMEISSGGVASATTMSGGTINVLSGGVASATTMSGGTMVVFSGGVASDTIVSGGTMNVTVGGVVAPDTTVGGVVAPDTTVSGGSLTILEGGTHRGMLSIASGAVVSAYSGAVIDFTMAAQEDKDVPLIDRYDYIAGAGDATYTLTIASNLETGSYALAGYAANFNSTITVTDAQLELGSLSVNGILKTDDFTYSLFLTDGTLFLGVNLDSEAPVLSSISASPSEATNQDVTVTATFTDNVGIASTQYRINGGAWQDYDDGVVMTANGMVEFRAADAAGNVSDIVTYEVTNIDKVAPEAPTASASTTEPTNQSVTVTAVFSDDSVTKEYSLDGNTWSDYTQGIVFSDNGTVYFRGTDAAGNVSEITNFAVTNIDKVAPVFSGIQATATSSGALLVASATDDVALASIEYRLDDGEWLTCPAGGAAVSEAVSIEFRATDTAGNTAVTARSFQTGGDGYIGVADGNGNVQALLVGTFTGDIIGTDRALGSGTVSLDIQSASVAGNVYGIGGAGMSDTGAVTLALADSTLDAAGKGVFASLNSNIRGNVSVTLTDMDVQGGYICAGCRINDGDSYSIAGDVSLSIDGTTMNNTTSSLVYGGGWLSDESLLKIKGDLNVTLDDFTASGVTYGGAKVQGNSDFVVAGDLNMTINGGSYVAVAAGGQVTKNGGMSKVTGMVNLTINGGTFASFVGVGAQCSAGGNFVVGKGTNVTITGGTFNGVVFAGAYSQGGAGQISGDTSLTISGGTFNGVVYGGSYASGSNSANALITGDTSVTIDASNGPVTFGAGSFIYAGSVGYGVIGGNTSVTFTGDGDNLVFQQKGSKFAKVLGDSVMYEVSGISYVAGGTKSLVLDDFTGTLDTQMYFFNDFKAINGTSASLGKAQNGLAEVASWTFDLQDGATTLAWAAGNNDFAGDTLALSFDTTLGSATVIDGGAASVLNGWDSFAGVTFNGTDAQWSDSLGGYTDNTWLLTADETDHDLRLARLA